MHDTNEEVEALREQADRFRARLEELAPDDPLLAEYSSEGSTGSEE